MKDLTFFEKYEGIYNRYLDATTKLDVIGDTANKLSSKIQEDKVKEKAENLWDFCIAQNNDIRFRTADFGLYLSNAYYQLINTPQRSIDEYSKDLIIEKAKKINIDEVECFVTLAMNRLDNIRNEI